MISFIVKGSFKNTEDFLEHLLKDDYMNILHSYGQLGVMLLASVTPIDTGKTALSWNYEIKKRKNSISLIWTNNNIIDGVPIVVLLQYGHATKNGGFVQGYDFINPAIQPLFDKIANDVWREVVRS